MIYDFISVFALVLVALECVALVWIIYDRRHETRAMALWRSTYESVAKNLRLKLAEIEKQTPTALVVEVAELRDAVARLAKTHQRFAGRFDQYVKDDSLPDNSPPTLDRDALRREHASAIMPAGIRK